MSRMDIWLDTYRKHLATAVQEHPTEYAYSLAEVPQVCERMRTAFERGSYNKDGRAIKETCKALGVKHNYTAINAYIKGDAQ